MATVNSSEKAKIQKYDLIKHLKIAILKELTCVD
jgi:hypothetical protein